jgi:hypothetical protein
MAAEGYIAIRDGGKTNEEGAQRLLNKLAGTQNEGIIGTNDLLLEESDTPSMDVTIAPGDIVINYLDYHFHGFIDTEQELTIAPSDPSNPRDSRIIAYVDLGVVNNANSNNPGALKIIEVAGSPAGSPTEPNDSAVQSAVGAGNPWDEIGKIRVGAGVTSILQANITDRRSNFVLGSTGKFGFYIGSVATVANNLSWNPIVSIPQQAKQLIIYAKTAPTGASLIARIYNITQNAIVASVTLSAGSQFAVQNTMSNPNLNTNDVLRADITQIGSTIPGSDISLILV